MSNIRWENIAPGNEFARDFCAGIGPLQLGVVLVISKIQIANNNNLFSLTSTRLIKENNFQYYRPGIFQKHQLIMKFLEH